MNRHLALLLQLQELVLMRKARVLVQPDSDSTEFEGLDQKISKLRHKLPGDILSQFDQIMRQHPDALVLLADGICTGCQQAVAPRLAARVQDARDLIRCPHCGRFVFFDPHAPPFVEFQ